jgi:hypothetical protein
VEEGGFYLVQQVEIDYGGHQIKGTEYIGYEESSGKLRSYFFRTEGPGPFRGVSRSSMCGSRSGMHSRSGAATSARRRASKSELSADRDAIWGRGWWPGGGYAATMARVGG